MASNVYTKNEILQILASKGYFIDSYTLNTFFSQWNVEAIFEDEQGSEFFDKNTLDIVLNNMFNAKNGEEQKTTPQVQGQAQAQPQFQEQLQNQAQVQGQLQGQLENQNIQPQPLQIQQTMQMQQPQMQSIMQQYQKPSISIDDKDTKDFLGNVSLSDGTPLLDKIQTTMNISPVLPTPNIIPVEDSAENIIDAKPPKKKTLGILEGAMQQKLGISQPFGNEEGKTIEDFNNQTEQITSVNSTLDIKPELIPPIPDEADESSDFDDMCLISDSIEAQEKFREYVVSEFAKKDGSGLSNPQANNEFKLDISERTISMIAKTMAKKIAKHVSSIYSADTKSMVQLEEMREENKILLERTKSLEDQNRKLKLLLAESNKNLDSYKKTFFGLYKKTKPY